MDKQVMLCATNGNYDVIRFGRQYAVVKKGTPIKEVKDWFPKSLLYSLIVKGGYDYVRPETPYSE